MHDRVAIRSGHGVGKSALLAWVALWFLLTRFPSKIACTAPTSHQLEDVLWGEISKWHRKLIAPLREAVEINASQVFLKAAPKEAFAVARTARKESPETFQGFHSENMLFIVDEASGVEDIIFEVGEGAMTTPGAKTIMAGNPTRSSGYFHDAFYRMRDHWRRFQVSCVTASEEPERKAALVKYAAEMADRYGAESNIYRVRVLGEFPESEDDVVIPLSWCEAAVGRDVAMTRGFRTVWGLDVARFGDDRSALAKRNCNVLLERVKHWRGLDLMQTCGRVMAEYETACDEDELHGHEPEYQPLAPSEILVDVIGLGAGVVDRLRELGLPARGVNVGEAPSGGSSTAGQQFMRLRDELWWKAREWFEARDCSMPPDEAFTAELTGPKYSFTSSGRIKIESKDEMKKRGVQSPDLGDAFCLTFAGGLQRIERHISSRYRESRRRKPRGSWMSV